MVCRHSLHVHIVPPDIFGRQRIKEQTICLLIIFVCYNLSNLRMRYLPFIQSVL
jgi:hypothetical protein